MPEGTDFTEVTTQAPCKPSCDRAEAGPVHVRSPTMGTRQRSQHTGASFTPEGPSCRELRSSGRGRRQHGGDGGIGPEPWGPHKAALKSAHWVGRAVALRRPCPRAPAEHPKAPTTTQVLRPTWHLRTLQNWALSPMPVLPCTNWGSWWHIEGDTALSTPILICFVCALSAQMTTL